MKSFQLRLSSLALVASGFVSPSIAFAQPEECAEDTDCEHGYTCEVTAVSGCAQPACEPETACEPVDCANVEYRSCMPATDCDDDADCADGMVCHSYEQESCSDVACSSEEDCAEQKPVCESEMTSACTPRSQLPCVEASECGEGFDCVMLEECSCSGGGSDPGATEPAPAPAEGSEGSAPPADGADGDQSSGEPTEADVEERPLPPKEEANCVCEPSDVGYCQAKLIECDTDAECPADWTCQQAGTAVPPSAGGDQPATDVGEPAEGEALVPPEERPAGNAVDGGAAEPSSEVPVDDDAEPAEDPAPEQGYCVPPFSGGSIPPGAEEPGRPATGEATGGGDNAGEGSTDANGEPSGSTDDEIDADDGSDDKDPVPSEPEDSDNPAGADAGHDDLTDDESDMGAGEQATNDDDGGCSVAAAPKSGSSKAPWLLGLLGLALLRRRR